MCAVEEEAQPRREVVDPQAAGEALVDVVEPVGQGERQLLHRRGTGLADVVAAYRHRVPAGHVPGAELDQVDHQPHGGLGREDELVLGVVLLEDVVLSRAPQPARVQALVLGVGEEEGHDDYCRGVDRQGHRDLIEVDAVVELADVLDRVDCDPEPADLAVGAGGRRCPAP